MYPLTCRHVTWRTVKAIKNGGLGQNHSLKVNFQNSSIKVQYRTAIDVSPEFHADLSCYKEMRIHCIRCKNSTLLTAILRPFGPGRQHFNTWNLTSAYTSCKILSGSVKVCRSYSPYYSKQVYWICLCSNVLYADKTILTIADFEQIHMPWQCRPTIRYFTAICKVTTSKFYN